MRWVGQSAPATDVVPSGLQSTKTSELEEADWADDDDGLLLAELDDDGGRGGGGEGESTLGAEEVALLFEEEEDTSCDALAGVIVDADDSSTTPFAEDNDVDEAPLGVRGREGGGAGAGTGAARIALEDASRNLQ
jgi:hypothetical protein